MVCRASQCNRSAHSDARIQGDVIESISQGRETSSILCLVDDAAWVYPKRIGRKRNTAAVIGPLYIIPKFRGLYT